MFGRTGSRITSGLAPRLGEWLAVFFAICAFGLATCSRDKGGAEQSYNDAPRDWPEGKTPADFPESAVDPFHGMDGGVPLTADEVKGRNTWLVWTSGNAAFWDWLARYGYGTNDLLKTIDSRKRSSRFREMGLVNEPGYRSAAQPDALGLWLDVRADTNPEPFDTLVYGKSTGVVGLRLFPNPAFDAAARQHWNARRYYTDPNYYNDKSLVRPYMIGMACSFCHVSPNPLRPPADPENPAWENLSSNIGNQYFRTAAVFGNGMTEDSFVFQILQAMEDGTLDTSFLATDNILNPSNMNSIFEVGGRLSVATEEKMGKATLAIRGEKETMKVPHILKDGSDNVGLVGALSRVFVNIGEYHQEWIKDHNALVGGRPQRPFSVANAQRNSVYWLATENRVNNLASFFLKAAQPMHLEDAPGGSAFLTKDTAILSRGKIVFAENCASCHSSKVPPAGVDPMSADGKAFYRRSVMSPDFRTGNFLSTDKRIPVTTVKTNACRALATNSTRGHVWDNFSSETYKSSPSVGQIEVSNPFTGATSRFQAPSGGPGYYRVPTLVSIWATAPFLHNNALGAQTHDPSVAGRMRAFDDAIQKLLWPEKRLNSGSIKRTTRVSYIWIPEAYLPSVLKPLADSGYLRIGPIPAKTPVSLLANVDMTFTGDPQADVVKGAKLFALAQKIKFELLRIKLQRLDAAQSTQVLRNLVPDLLALSKCPDFIEDRGHLFGTTLTDSDKNALIEFLKTL